MTIEGLKLRAEKPEDQLEIERLIVQAFANIDVSDQTEHLLVRRLRASVAYIPELALIAKMENKIAGFILLTRIKLGSINALALAPVCVLPEFQKRGIGAALIEQAHEKAKKCGYELIALIGHPNYYPRFGYLKASDFGIEFPFEAPDECCMVLGLQENTLAKAEGRIQYPQAFYG